MTPDSQKKPSTILAVDCGSTTTKAILFGVGDDGHFKTLGRGEAPTTVEAPFEDVMIGLRNSVNELEALTGRRLLGEDTKLIMPADEKNGVDLFCATSSAGGGLQMMVTGLVRSMTAESAERAALGAGAIVMDVLSADDGRPSHERVRRVRQLRPDIVLISGGVDGGALAGVVEFAELMVAADPRPRFGTTFKLPVVYAGNKDAAEEVLKLTGDKFALETVPNIRPTLEREELGPARAAIHEAFLNHVMSHAPGYHTLMDWASVPILSTPDAVGRMAQAAASARGQNILAVDIGGATTDMFSVFNGEFHRTVSANLGMSYSLANVVVEAGAANILRWLPFEIGESDLRDRLRNKMVRPTTIPEVVEDLRVEQAAAREALRLALAHHKSLARPLKGVVRQRTIGDTFDQSGPGEDIVDMTDVGLIIGSGGVLSHAPSRSGSFLMMLDAFQPCGVTQMAVDSIFMMPHLGAFSTVDAEAATEVFERDCLVPLGAVIAPWGKFPKTGTLLEAEIRLPGGAQNVTLEVGDFKRVDLPAGEKATGTLKPVRNVDVGAGPGNERTVELSGGETGIVLDGRGRPLAPSTEDADRQSKIAAWLETMGLSGE